MSIQSPLYYQGRITVVQHTKPLRITLVCYKEWVIVRYKTNYYQFYTTYPDFLGKNNKKFNDDILMQKQSSEIFRQKIRELGGITL